MSRSLGYEAALQRTAVPDSGHRPAAAAAGPVMLLDPLPAATDLTPRRNIVKRRIVLVEKRLQMWVVLHQTGPYT